jgi:malonate-semialdehyde dehydrogenase (acetylating)/methylmalonate-semialdehyde dehydrogenase
VARDDEDMTGAATAPSGPELTGARTLSNYIGGEWREPIAEATQESRNPATGELLAQVPLSGAADVDAAARAAREAFPAWRATSPLKRARAVFALRDLLDAHRDELARIVTTDMGKTLADAAGEVGRGIESTEAACAAPHMLKGDTLEGVASGLDVEMVRQPVGVIGAITPFNFPAMIPLWFLPYAVVCGNTFVLKPSEADPLTSARLFELIDGAAIFPPGVVNLVHGGRDAVGALLDHPQVDGISFVGSAATARIVYTRAAESGKRVQALGGAKNAMTLMPDADPDLMLNGVLGSAFGAAGQRCLAGSIAVLVGSEAEQDRTRDLLLEGAGRLRVGDGADPGTDVCPLVTPAARERVSGEIDRAEAEGAEIVLDGRRDPGSGGALLGPTIVDRAAPGSAMLTEEIFGPVLTLLRVPDLETALARINESPYGNASSIFTSSGGAAREYRYGVEAGMVGVNVGVAAPVAWFPFSGWKASLDGDLPSNGADAFEFYTRKKVVTARWA